jgi:hypothetical protein
LLAVTIAGPTLSGNLASAAASSGVPSTSLGAAATTENAPVVREVVEDWFRQRMHLSQSRLDDANHRGPEYADAQTVDCPAGEPGDLASAR